MLVCRLRAGQADEPDRGLARATSSTAASRGHKRFKGDKGDGQMLEVTDEPHAGTAYLIALHLKDRRVDLRLQLELRIRVVGDMADYR
jgi:hypothetical protein